MTTEVLDRPEIITDEERVFVTLTVADQLCGVPVLGVRDVAASTMFYARLGFLERFRDDPDSPRFMLLGRDDAVLALQWHDFVGVAGVGPAARAPGLTVPGCLPPHPGAA